MTRPTLLCAAEPWGFGPAAKLFAILRSLHPRPRLVAVQAGSALSYAEANSELVDAVVHLDSPFDVLGVEEQFDAVLTVMDPWAALLGARRGVPVCYVDSLFWFWDWSTIDFGTVPSSAAWWVGASPAELGEATSQPLNWHHITPLAYHWSTRVFAQRSADADLRAKHYPPGLVDVVGAIIDPAPATEPADREPPLVSISGAVSHLTPPAVARRYARLVRRLLEGAGDGLAGATVTGNPSLLDVFEPGPWQPKPLDAVAMQAAMTRASVLLAPAGLTTAFEAASMRTPLILLPEQHGGHAPNTDLLQAADPGAYDNLLLRNWIALTNRGPEGAIAELDAAYQRLASAPAGDDVLAPMAGALRAALRRLADPARRRDCVERQRANVQSVVGDFDGARAVSSAVTDLLTATAAG